MCNALLLTNLSTPTAVVADATVPLGSAIHGVGSAIRMSGNALQIYSSGYYDITANVSFEVTGANAVTLQLYANGVPVPGAVASATPGAAGEIVNITLPWIYKKGCCCDPTTLSYVVSQAGTVNSTIVTVEKI